MTDMLKKVPVREQEAKVRAANFDEVCLGYNLEEAMLKQMRYFFWGVLNENEKEENLP